MSAATPTLSLVVPFYNEEGSVAAFFEEAARVLDGLDVPCEIVCINDGSADGTQAELLEWQGRVGHDVVVVELSRNFGKEAALSAGLDIARGDAVIPMDCDLQDPPDLIPRMVEKWREGFEVVLCARADRSTDGFAKRWTAAAFYRFHNVIAEQPLPENVGDFRLLDRKVVDVIKTLPERQRFMKGLLAWPGFRQTTIPYVRAPRAAGASKWNWWRLWNLALDGITSFSTVPLRLWTYVGGGISLIAFLYAGFLVVRTLIMGVDVPGYASLMVAVLFLGGLQLLSLGILGEYIGRIHGEVKQRPVYVVRSVSQPPKKPSKGSARQTRVKVSEMV